MKHFINGLLKLKNIFNKSIKFIRSDNGTEFLNNNLKTYTLNSVLFNNLQYHITPIKWSNDILINCKNVVLNDFKLNREFWEYAVDTANISITEYSMQV